MNNLALVTENDVEIQLRATVQELLTAAEDVVIMSRADLSQATDLVKAIKSRFRDAEDERKRLVKPFNDGVDAINARFKAMTVPLKDAEDGLKGKMLAFQQEEERRANEEAARQEKARKEAEEKRRAEAEAQAAESDRAPLPISLIERPVPPITPQHKPTTYGQTGAVSTVKKQWTFEVEDISKVPAEYLLIDQVKVNQAVRAGARDIAGLRIFEKDILQVR